MAFNLKKVLRALLFSTSQPLSVKDIQAAFTRFHEQAAMPQVDGEDSADAPVPETPGAEPAPASPLAAEAIPAIDPLALAPENPELYGDVPSLITSTQIRETMDEIATELREADQGLVLIDGSNGYRLATSPDFARWIRVLRNEPPPVKLSQTALETLAVIGYRQPVTRTEIEHIRGVSAEAGLNKLLERELVYIVGRADLPGRPLQYGTTDKFLEFVGIKSISELPASDVLSNRQIDEWLQKTTTAKPPTDAEMGLPLELGEGLSPNLDDVDVPASAPAADASPENEPPANTDGAPATNEPTP
jgi:segregation and condensation protein B